MITPIPAPAASPIDDDEQADHDHNDFPKNMKSVGLREFLKAYVYHPTEVRAAWGKTTKSLESLSLKKANETEISMALLLKHKIPSNDGCINLKSKISLNYPEINWMSILIDLEKCRHEDLKTPYVEPIPDDLILDPFDTKMDMPDGFKELHTAICIRLNRLRAMLSDGHYTAEGLHPKSSARAKIEARTWVNPEMAIEVSTGNLINTRTNEIEWRDVTIATHEAAAASKNKGGRTLGDAWVEAFDYLNVHMGLDWKDPAETGSELADRLVEALEATGSKGYDRDDAAEWLQRNQWPLWRRATAKYKN